ncbi:hypothetical protein [Dysgonomonas sp. GY617]|uniref:hypothetical protein n=1 Tax=Dysgonomonas sp. GY617 TaxID=2780420 RepID=UPI0018845718|nr:hypothetical protein [Dysgonomonas sp. GY617]MBF0574407.1 hypothetical protein [Dysgonomonas sp. GY617]
MKEKKELRAWLFICFVVSERKYVCHVIATPLFSTALQEHAALFPSHHVVFSLQVPLYLAEYIGKELQYFFKDSEAVYKEFVRLVNSSQGVIIAPVKTYNGLVPLSFSDVSKCFCLSRWNGEYYENAQAFILSPALVEFFNFLFFQRQDVNPLNLFKV